ncbi:MAG: phosphoglycerate kinase [Nitrososphaerota archaeon]|jgi:phosphoglycerate kinase|nr:phosphoglycerate kinase [Nitrososphaerota archaeon]MDG6937194.1 phosphoglycerate kinase [Nitrososphaerota archaeon]MDG6961792.1 phosphoglycerate kinase [Nitrososphaerota archaeon]MDG6970306.1 phosphoglycerate kinase [Nitrososphaerota archaeon]MDG6972436.1 phosphoglycerate kinase [Nitrososphaerota archaeon]
MAIKMLTLEDLELGGKRVFLRVDINTPIHPETGALMERARLEEAAMTVRDLPKSRVVVASHQGRVGRPDYTSLEAHAKALGEILGREVAFVPDVFGPEALSQIDSLQDGEVLMLDNLRFTAEENQEYKPDEAEKSHLIRRLGGHVDACVLDAFSTAHRASPTIIGFAGLVPTCAGRTVGRELRMLDRIATVEKGPYVTVLGGAKVNDRLEAIDALIANGRADSVLLSGVVGLVFLKAAGKLRGDIGVDKEQAFVVRARRLMDDDPDRFVLPLDVAVKAEGGRKEVEPSQIASAAQVLDIGSKSVDRFSRYIKGAGTVFMSGPAGAFEWEEFSLGTEGLLRAMASSLGTTIISGGHLSTALRKYGINDQIDHVSTAGGALVQYLAGKRLPLIDALERAAERWGRSQHEPLKQQEAA